MLSSIGNFASYATALAQPGQGAGAGGGAMRVMFKADGQGGIDKADLSKLFSKGDTNGDGKIDKSELTSMLEKLSGKSDAAGSNDVDSALKALDSDNDGSISEQEFTDNAQSLLDALRNDALGQRFSTGDAGKPSLTASVDPEELFKSLDTNGDGSISEDEFKTNAQSLFDKLKGSESDYAAQNDANNPRVQIFMQFFAAGDQSGSPLNQVDLTA